jgi:hypothetical protein
MKRIFAAAVFALLTITTISPAIALTDLPMLPPIGLHVRPQKTA